MRTNLPRQPITGTTDATGAATITGQLKGPSAYYALVYIAVQVAVGAASWAVLAGEGPSATGSPLVYGSGNQVMLGPILLLPGERVTLTVSGAGAGSVILGQAMGWMADTPEELLGVTPLTTSLATPVTPVPVSGSVSILGTPNVVTNPGSKTTLIGGVSGQVQGDVSAPQLVADSATETITTAGGPMLNQGIALVMASFKPATTIALVAAGAVAQGSNTSVSPAFAQAPAAGHLLVCCVTAGTGEPTTSRPGWVKAVDTTPASQWAAIWYKLNSAGNDLAPVFTSPGGTTPMHAQLFEYSGALTAAALDQIGGVGNGNVSTLTVTNTGVDAAFGDLVVICSRWALTSAATATFAETFNNAGVAVHDGDSGSVSQVRQSSFAHTIIPAAQSSQPLGVGVWDYDATGTSSPAAGSQASVVLAATAGKAYRLAMYTSSVLWSAGPASATGVSLLDGASTKGNLAFLGTTAAGVGNNFGESGLSIKGTAGNSMTVQFNAALAGIFESVTAGAYLR